MDVDDAAASPDEQPPPSGEPAPAAAGAAGGQATPTPAETGSRVAVPTSLLGQAIASLQEAQRTGHDRLLRLAAEHENYKKRSRKEQSEATRRAEDKTILELLPVVDNLERALSHAEAKQGEVSSDGALLEGVKMVHKQFLAALERLGVKPLESVGQPFDPEHHEAIQQAASPLPPGIICLEAQRGYLRAERLLRPAMVVVSLGPVTASPAPAAEAEKPAEASGGEAERSVEASGGEAETSSSGES